ncbi:MAG: helix-turn-helix domain-containing protein [Bacteroidales bacterium]|nr:helix-turn-helix domain-containing protein [Bacteroidales bacterium]MBN2819782.1 helix-turn-helix domain-containing protein [Bacteroidales bacterium]
MISKYSIAVLPFTNMSSDTENEYFSDGITEEILNALTKIEGLHVTARTSSFAFKNQNLDAREIGKKLNVAFVLEGSIRKSGAVVRITAQLIKSSDGFHVWSDSWDRELKNIFIVQDEIAGIIAEKVNADIKPKTSKSVLVLDNTDALDYYLRGIYLLNTWDFREGQNMIHNFERAIQLDPNLVKAYVGLCRVYTWLGATGNVKPEEAFMKVDYCIRKIQELDKDNPEILIQIAGKLFWIEWEIGQSLQMINKALLIQPSNADALLFKGIILASLGRVEESLDCLFQADRLDPYADQIKSGIGMIYNYTNENEKALEYVEENIKICPRWYAQYLTKVEALCKLGRYKEARDTITMLEKDESSPLSANQLKAYYYASKGDVANARVHLKLMEEEQPEDPTKNAPDSAFFSQIYVMLGEKEKALDYLEHGMKYKAAPFLFFLIDSMWNELRMHPRYVNATKALKFNLNNKESAGQTRKYKKSTINESQAVEISNKLNKFMHTEKPWLNPTLTLYDLAEGVDLTTNQLSQILNEFLHKNFYDYINSFRLEYFLKLKKENKFKDFTILGLAYESGFNSKTTFNTFFKKTTGKTPSEYFRG